MLSILKKPKYLIGIIILLVALIFTRFYNLPATTRFTRDESSNLVDMHRIWKEKKITLVGPVDVNNIVIYPSLTFYMLMPFAVAGNFSPQSPAYGTAFFGVLAVVLIIMLTKKINKKFILFTAVLGVVWYPFVESSRWAWNPHLVPFMMALALLFWLKSGAKFKFISGIFFGLVFHLHYFAFVSFAVFWAIYALMELKNKNFKEPFFMGLGFTAMLIPFVVFDIKNPPGLFFGKFLSNNLVSQGFSTKLTLFGNTFPSYVYQTLLYITQNNILAVVCGVAILILFIYDLKKTRKNLLFFFPVLTQVAGISFLPYFAGRYFLLASVMFICWLVSQRGKVGTLLAKFIILVMILGSILNIKILLTKPQQEPGGGVVGSISTYIAGKIASDNLKNVNLAVIESPDPDPLGVIYRQTLLVKEERILPESQYNLTDNLFIITTGSEASLRGDASNVMNGFRKGKASLVYELAGTPWKVYLFNKDQK